MFAGARGYIGTLAKVDTVPAKQIAEEIFSNLSEKVPLCINLWEAQKKVYADPRNRIYVQVGCHFSNILPTNVDSEEFVKEHIRTQLVRMGQKLEIKSNPEDVQRNISKAVQFLKKQLKVQSN